MSINKRTSKVKNGILIALIIAFLIMVIAGTYARYGTTGAATANGEIANWHIELGGEDISSEEKTVDVVLTPEEESNENVTAGKIAPGQTLSGELVLDPTGSEVAIDYLLTMGNVQATSGTWNTDSSLSLSRITALLEDDENATELTVSDSEIIYFENLNNVVAGKGVTFKVYVTWDNADNANNEADTANGEGIEQITVPITVVARQHIDDGTSTYTVTFKDGETTLSTSTVGEGQTVARPVTDPTKEGYDFVNWYSDSEFTTVYDFTSAINGDTTIYAKWEATSTVATLPTGTYTVGQEVVYNSSTSSFEVMTSSNSSNSEHFYVVSDEGTKVNLLSKYCLLRDASAQTDKDATYNGEGTTTAYGRVFSRTNYWKGKDGVTTTFDLQTTTALGWIPSADTAENNAILAAQAYGESKGVNRKINEKRRS